MYTYQIDTELKPETFSLIFKLKFRSLQYMSLIVNVSTI